MAHSFREERVGLFLQLTICELWDVGLFNLGTCRGLFRTVVDTMQDGTGSDQSREEWMSGRVNDWDYSSVSIHSPFFFKISFCVSYASCGYLQIPSGKCGFF